MRMSGNKRRSTVHDLTSLRLHPDGTKVKNADTNLKPRKAKYATKDAKGNWIAQDAGGLGRVKTRRMAAKQVRSGDEAQEHHLETKDGLPAVAKGKHRAVETDFDVELEEDDEYVVKDSRAKRRKAFAGDLGFLNPQDASFASTRANSVASDEDATVSAVNRLSLPSSDLLKCIHYFASAYYAEMGQLKDSSRAFRRERTRRRLQKLQPVSSSGRAKREHAAGSSTIGSFGSSEEEDDDDSGRQENEGEEGEETGERNRQTSADAGSCKTQDVEHRAIGPIGTDMYKVCDGSALMAIGMLLQHHIADSLKTRIPDGWEQAMLESGQVPWGGDDRPQQEVRKDRSAESSEEQASFDSEDEDSEDDEPMDMDEIDELEDDE